VSLGGEGRDLSRRGEKGLGSNERLKTERGEPLTSLFMGKPSIGCGVLFLKGFPRKRKPRGPKGLPAAKRKGRFSKKRGDSSKRGKIFRGSFFKLKKGIGAGKTFTRVSRESLRRNNFGTRVAYGDSSGSGTLGDFPNPFKIP